jgi:hypothetical protein
LLIRNVKCPLCGVGVGYFCESVPWFSGMIDVCGLKLYVAWFRASKWDLLPGNVFAVICMRISGREFVGGRVRNPGV